MIVTVQQSVTIGNAPCWTRYGEFSLVVMPGKGDTIVVGGVYGVVGKITITGHSVCINLGPCIEDAEDDGQMELDSSEQSIVEQEESRRNGWKIGK